MGDPKKFRKKYKTPRQPYVSDRIDIDLQMIGKYGLRNLREAWKNTTMLRSFRVNARKLLSLEEETRKIGEQELLGRLLRMGLVTKKATLEDVLSLKVEDFLERRLQTLVFKKGLATTPYHARQMIIHGHIAISDRVINSPSYFITPSEESQIGFSYNSPLLNASHKALPSNVYKTRPSEERAQAHRHGAIHGKIKKKPFVKEELEVPKKPEEEEEKPTLSIPDVIDTTPALFCPDVEVRTPWLL